MSDLIALHWAHDRVTAFIPGKGTGGRVAVFENPVIGTADSASLGKWLKTELASHKIGGKRAAVVLPRAAAIFRKLSLPQLPDEELPDVVRMQAATKSSTPLDRLRFDFVPLAQRGEGREALLASVPAKTVDDIAAVVRAAGLEPFTMGLSPFGTAAKVVNGDESCLIVAIDEHSAEITLVRDRTVQFSHIGDLPGGEFEEDRQWLSSEISRAVIAADHLAAGGGIDRVVLLGPAELLEPLSAPLAQRYDAKAELFDTPQSLGFDMLDGAAPVSILAAVAGQLAPTGAPRIDLLNPRKRIEKPDHTRLRVALGVAAAAAVLAAAYGMSWLKQSDLQEHIAELDLQKTQNEATLSAGEPAQKAYATIEAWNTKQADWTEQFVELDSVLPGTNRIYLTELSLDPGQRDSLGAIKGLAYARTETDVRSFQDALSAAGYLVKAPSTVGDLRDPEYPKRFVLDLTIPKSSGKPATSAKTAPAT